MLRLNALLERRARGLALAAAWSFLVLASAGPSWAQVIPPLRWELLQNAPDPYCAALDGTTLFGFAAPERARFQLALFSPDSTTVVRQFMDATGFGGYYTFHWDGRDDSAALVPDGRYPYTLVATDVDTQALLFSGSKATTVRCATGVESPPWSAVKLLFR